MSHAHQAVFLSYASQDAEAAKKICEALRAAGVEVWFDQSELVGGDAWDQKIRGQIKSCALFVPVISADTQARREGYFRLEWKLAAQRTHTMADGTPFLLPVVIDETRDSDALVPEEFRAVQWTRLPAGEHAERFCARVRTLLFGEVAQTPKPSSVPGAPAKLAPPDKRRAWLIFGTLALGATVALALWQPWQGRSTVIARGADAPEAKIPLSEARRLAEQARALIYKPDAARAEFEAAGELCRKAAGLDSTDAEVLAIWSQADTWLVANGFDIALERREAARSRWEAALQFAPASYEARFAEACWLVRGTGEVGPADGDTRADEILKDLLRERPDEPRALLTRGRLLARTNRGAEARAIFTRMAETPALAAMAWRELGWTALTYSTDYRTAEEAADRSIEAQPTWFALTLKMLLAVEWRGDLDLALATQQRMPEIARQEDIGVVGNSYLYYVRHEPERMLQVLDSAPREWIHTVGYDGPKAVYAALAHEQLGNQIRAAAQWNEALRLIERRLAERPDEKLQLLQAYVLAALGRKSEAETALALVRGAAVPPPFPWLRRSRYVLIQLRLGHPDAALDFLEKDSRLTAAVLRRDPALDPLRALPRLQALQARLDADPSRSPEANAMVQGPALPAAPDEKPAPADKSVAVLAFENLSDEKSNEYFSDGISEELLNQLGKVPGLRVAGRASAFSFKGRNAPETEIAQRLSVAYVVNGAVQKFGTRVRITARLISGRDGFQVWSEKFDKELKDAFALEDEIAGLIAQNLQLKLGYAPRTAKAINPEAHRLVLEGVQYWNHRTEAGFAQAEKLFSQALTIDRDFAPAHAGLAQVYSMRANFRLTDGRPGGKEDTARALVEARHAIALDGTLAEPFTSLAFALLGDRRRWDEAEQSFRRALELNPNYALAHLQYQQLFYLRGQLDRALEEVDAGLELDPLSYVGLWLKAKHLKNARRYTEALALGERARTAAEAVGAASFLSLRGDQVEILLALRRIDAAVAVAREILRDPEATPRREASALAIWALHRAGLQAEAEAAAATVTERALADSHQRGFALVALGRFDEALPSLERVPPNSFDVLYTSVLFDPFREDPRFRQLVAKLGCDEEYKTARATLAHMREEHRM